MEQLVRVIKTHENGTATVVHIRESACSGDCHKCSGCGAAKETIVFDAVNALGARVGDLVKVEAASGPVLQAALILYMLPMALFFAGYGLGQWLFGMGGLGGAVCFALSIAIAVIYDRKVLKKKSTEYTITKYAKK
jgi:sigma-E factor negative regulatory protein RseC